MYYAHGRGCYTSLLYVFFFLRWYLIQLAHEKSMHHDRARMGLTRQFVVASNFIAAVVLPFARTNLPYQEVSDRHSILDRSMPHSRRSARHPSTTCSGP